MKHYLKKLATFLASTLFICALIAMPVSAQTDMNALHQAVREQIADCNSSFLYDCQNPLFIVPTCHNTGVDQAGQTQHICGGIFSRRRKLLPGGKPYCITEYWLSPFGRVMNFRTYKCYTALGLLPALRR